MANIKISELTALTPPDAADLVPVTDSSANQTKRTTVGEIVGIINGDVEVATDGTATISELPVSKLQDGDARQVLQTAANGTDVEWTSNVDLPGTLDVTGVATFDAAVNAAGLASLNGGIDVDGAFTVANTSGNIATSGTLSVSGQSTLASAAVSDLTSGRVVLAGASGEIEDSANLTFSGTQLDVGGNVVITGDLTVQGASTTLETQTVTVEDKNIELGVVATPTDTTADGGGITLKGTTDKTINWVDATDAWTFSEHVNIASAKEYRIAGTKVLDTTSLGSAVVTSSLTSVGTIGTGVWEGTAIDKTYLDATLVSTGDAGTVTSTMIADGTIVDADVNASAAIAGTKINPDFGSQNVVTTGTNTAASLIPTGSSVPTNGVYLPAANTVGVATNGTGRLFVDSGGRLLVGTSTSRIVNGAERAVQIEGISATAGLSLYRNTNDTTPVALHLGKSRGTAVGSNTIVQANDSLGLIAFYGSDGSAPRPGAWINASADGTPGANDMPGRLVFLTTPSGSETPTERLRITSAGLVGIGTSSPGGRLDVQGGDVYLGKTVQGDIFFSDGNDTYTKAANNIFFESPNGTTRLTVKGDTGHVGIGTASPSATSMLTVRDASNGSYRAENTLGGYALFGVTDSAASVGFLDATNEFEFRLGGSERARIDSSGRLLVGTSSDSGGALFQVNGDRIRIGTAKTPASASATGTTGEIAWDADYIYVCTATNTWKRVAIATW
jgi:uncharacterized Zn ribbon protein